MDNRLLTTGLRGVVALGAMMLALLMADPVFAQNVQNPKTLTFKSVDFASVERHEIEIQRTSDNTAIQTLTDTGPYTSENISVNINVQPVAFGEYVFRARACNTPNGCSQWSTPSNLWDRALWVPESLDAQ